MSESSEAVTLQVIPGAFRTSPSIAAISEAFVKAQSEFEAAKKLSQNPAYRSKYADISSVIETVLPPLNKNGIAVIQPARLEGQLVVVTTRLQHKSGEFWEQDLSIPAVNRDRFDAQSVCTGITYARRYGLTSMACLATEDDDGNAAAGIGSREQAQAVGKQKIAEMETKKAAAKELIKPILEFTYPEEHNRNYAKWTNVKEYAALQPTLQGNSLLELFRQYRSKNIGSPNSCYVPAEKMQELLEKLVGEWDMEVREAR